MFGAKNRIAHGEREKLGVEIVSLQNLFEIKRGRNKNREIDNSEETEDFSKIIFIVSD